jgi:uncharacterized protein (TIGR03067 family)
MPVFVALIFNVLAAELADFAEKWELKRQEAIQKELELFDGEWIVQSYLHNGVEQANQQIKGKNRCRISANQFSVELDDVLVLHESYSIEPSRTPKRIDLGARLDPASGTSTNASNDGSGTSSSSDNRRKGIYELKGDTLTIVFAAAPEGSSSGSTGTVKSPRVTKEEIARPKSFDAARGSKRTFIVLKRAPQPKEEKQ